MSYLSAIESQDTRVESGRPCIPGSDFIHQDRRQRAAPSPMIPIPRIGSVAGSETAVKSKLQVMQAARIPTYSGSDFHPPAKTAQLPPRLSASASHRISARMRTIITLLLLALATPAVAQPLHKPPEKPAAAAAAAPKEIGKFDDWIAATHQEAGQTVCYAFTRARHSAPALPGRGDVC